MTELTVDKNLRDRLKETIENVKEKDLPQSHLQSLLNRAICDEIAEYVSEKAMNLSKIEETVLAYGSGDTGRGTALKLKPTEDATKEDLREIGENLDRMLSATDNGPFPDSYIISITHPLDIDEEGYPKDGDSFYLQLSYRVRTRAKPQEPAGNKTEILTKNIK